jgi:hypothetical protein
MRRLLPLALLLFAVSAHAQVYKWKDASGTVHYADAPPPAGAEYKSVKTTGTAAPLAPMPAPAPAASSAGAAGAPQPIKDTPENRARVCAQLKGNMDLLSGIGPLSVSDAKGASVPLDAQRRKQELATASEQYKQTCAR